MNRSFQVSNPKLIKHDPDEIVIKIWEPNIYVRIIFKSLVFFGITEDRIFLQGFKEFKKITIRILRKTPLKIKIVSELLFKNPEDIPKTPNHDSPP